MSANIHHNQISNNPSYKTIIINKYRQTDITLIKSMFPVFFMSKIKFIELDIVPHMTILRQIIKPFAWNLKTHQPYLVLLSSASPVKSLPWSLVEIYPSPVFFSVVLLEGVQPEIKSWLHLWDLLMDTSQKQCIHL